MFQQVMGEQLRSSIELPTGVRLSFVEQGNVEGEAIVMLHGYTDSSHSYARVLPLISARYHLFALDQRGHGDSSKNAPSHTLEEMADDVLALINTRGIDKIILVGHSMGSMVAQRFAAIYPERVARLVLIGAFVIGAPEEVHEVGAVVEALEDPIDPAFAREFQSSTVFGSVPADFFEEVIQESLKVPALVWRQALASCLVQNTEVYLPHIKAPTLIFWGDHETYVPWRDQETLMRLIPNAKLLVYEECGHCPHWEQPEKFVVDFEVFLHSQ
jgi:pimeloyl-ACP methyl ester carboxylesterase